MYLEGSPASESISQRPLSGPFPVIGPNGIAGIARSFPSQVAYVTIWIHLSDCFLRYSDMAALVLSPM